MEIRKPLQVIRERLGREKSANPHAILAEEMDNIENNAKERKLKPRVTFPSVRMPNFPAVDLRRINDLREQFKEVRKRNAESTKKPSLRARAENVAKSVQNGLMPDRESIDAYFREMHEKAAAYSQQQAAARENKKSLVETYDSIVDGANNKIVDPVVQKAQDYLGEIGQSDLYKRANDFVSDVKNDVKVFVNQESVPPDKKEEHISERRERWNKDEKPEKDILDARNNNAYFDPDKKFWQQSLNPADLREKHRERQKLGRSKRAPDPQAERPFNDLTKPRKQYLVNTFETNDQYRVAGVLEKLNGMQTDDWNDDKKDVLEVLYVARGTRAFTKLHEQLYQRMNQERLRAKLKETKKATNIVVPGKKEGLNYADYVKDLQDRAKLLLPGGVDEVRKSDNIKRREKNLGFFGGLKDRIDAELAYRARKDVSKTDRLIKAQLEAAERKARDENRLNEFIKSEDGQALKALRLLDYKDKQIQAKKLGEGLRLYKADKRLHDEQSLKRLMHEAKTRTGWWEGGENALKALKAINQANEIGIPGVAFKAELLDQQRELMEYLEKQKKVNSGIIGRPTRFFRNRVDGFRIREQKALYAEFSKFESRGLNNVNERFNQVTGHTTEDGKFIDRKHMTREDRRLLKQLAAGWLEYSIQNNEDEFQKNYGALYDQLRHLRDNNSGWRRILDVPHRVYDRWYQGKHQELAKNAQREWMEAQRATVTPSAETVVGASTTPDSATTTPEAETQVPSAEDVSTIPETFDLQFWTQEKIYAIDWTPENLKKLAESLEKVVGDDDTNLLSAFKIYIEYLGLYADKNDPMLLSMAVEVRCQMLREYKNISSDLFEEHLQVSRAFAEFAEGTKTDLSDIVKNELKLRKKYKDSNNPSEKTQALEQADKARQELIDEIRKRSPPVV